MEEGSIERDLEADVLLGGKREGNSTLYMNEIERGRDSLECQGLCVFIESWSRFCRNTVLV